MSGKHAGPAAPVLADADYAATETMSPSVCIVTLTWNHKEVTADCLASIQGLDYRPIDVVVVDNHSTDGAPALVRDRFPNAHLLVLDENLGFAAGMNAGIALALQRGAEMVLVLNNDTLLPPDFIERLVEMSGSDPNQEVGVFVPKICYDEDRELVWAAGAEWRRFPPIAKMIGFRKRDAPAYNVSKEIELATGCALLVRRQVFEQVGGFDPAFFMYYEDYDLCRRVRAHGWRIVYVPGACLWHRVSVSAGEGSPLKWYYWAQSAVLFYHRYLAHPRLALLAASAWVLLRELARGRLSFWRPYLRGLRDGFARLAARG